MQKKLDRFKNIDLSHIFIPANVLKPLRRDNAQYGWYIKIRGANADFGGSHISLDDSKQMAIQFIRKIQEMQDTLKCSGNPLEP